MSDQNRRQFLRTGGCVGALLAASTIVPAKLLALAAPITGEWAGSERSYPVPAVDGVSIDRDAQVILVRLQNHAFAFALSCPHQNAAVKWNESDRRFQCTKHDSKYQETGVYTSGRATRNMDRFAIRHVGVSLMVDLDRVFHSDTDPAGWAAAQVAL